MRGADFVQIDGVVFAAEYLRVPDETTVGEDVMMELKLYDEQLEFTWEDLDDAQYVGAGLYRLKVRQAPAFSHVRDYPLAARKTVPCRPFTGGGGHFQHGLR